MSDDTTFEAVNWDTVKPESRFEQLDDMLEPPDIPEVQEEPPKPDATLLKDRVRSRKEHEYSRKIRKVFGVLTRATITRPSTVPDAAAFLLYGPKVSDAVGRLAAEHENIEGAVNIIETMADSPYIAIVTSLSPLVAQLARNHEPFIEPQSRKIKIPVINREFSLPKVGFKLGIARSFTNDPDVLVNYVLGDPDVQKALAKNGITLATK